MTQKLTVLVAFAGLLLGALALGVGCTQRVVVVWPNEPLKVEIVNCPAVGGTLTVRPAGSDAGNPPGGEDAGGDKPPAEPRRARLTDKPLLLASGGQTVTWVDYDGGNYGGGVVVFDADAEGGDGETACARGTGTREVWKLANGGHWDAWHNVDKGKVLCAKASGYVEGEVKWQIK